MEKQCIREKSELDEVVGLVLTKIKKWTEKELDIMATQGGRPRVLVLGPGHYRVGNHSIKKRNNECWGLTASSGLPYDFMFGSSAVNYSLAKQLGLYELAANIKRADRLYHVHYVDFVLFQSRLTVAIATGVEWDIQLYEARKKQSETMYLCAHGQLANYARIAKYQKLHVSSPNK